jgi:hypothetical protein
MFKGGIASSGMIISSSIKKHQLDEMLLEGTDTWT